MKKRRFLFGGGAVAALGALLITSAHAGNAPWYRWESRLDGNIVCAQVSPGDGWKRIAGPYRDAACYWPR